MIRFLPLNYFIDCFRKNEQKLETLSKEHSEVKIIALDNVQNNGGKIVSVQDTLDWNFELNEEQLIKLLEYAEQ